MPQLPRFKVITVVLNPPPPPPPHLSLPDVDAVAFPGTVFCFR